MGNFTIYTHNYLVSDTLIPVVSFAPPGLKLAISTPTPVPPMPTPVTPTTTATRIPASQAVVTANALHLRAGPGNAYGIISVLAKGTKLAVLGRSSDSAWLQVRTSSGQIGWVFTRLVTLNVALGDIPTAPIPPTPTPSPRVTPARRQATLTPPSDIVIVRPHCSNPRVQMSQVRINQRTREVEIIGTAATASFAYFRIQLKPASADWRTASDVVRHRISNGLLFRDTLPLGRYRLALEIADAREEIPRENRCETSISVP